MADPTPDDETGVDPEAVVDDDGEPTPEAEADAGDAAPPKAKAPADPQADVAARRAATKARMDAHRGSAPSKATADDPTGAKARRRGKADAKGKAESMGKASAADPTGTKARREEATTTKKVPRPSKRTGGTVDPKAARTTAARSGNPKKVAEATSESSRYTAPIPRSQLESPTWVPVLMFGLLAVGMIVIFMTYVLWEGRPLALGVGLACILGGILAATQYR
ncbi:MAG: hypothetical protein ACR2JF_02450 [Iamia sp.]